jgi:hypothetical protein
VTPGVAGAHPAAGGARSAAAGDAVGQAGRSLRQDADHVIAAAAIGLWVLAAWPDRFSKALRGDILIFWAFLVLAGIVLRIVEWRRRVEFRRCMNAQTPESRSDREGHAR